MLWSVRSSLWCFYWRSYWIYFSDFEFPSLVFKNWWGGFLLLVDSVLLVVDCAVFDAFVCGQQCCTYIWIIFFWYLYRRKLIQWQ